MYERVLVPTDGSDGATPAVERAIDLAKTYGAELHVLNAVNTTAMSAEIDSMALFDRLEAQGERATEEIAEQAAEAGVGDVTTAVVEGAPHRAILEYAADNDVDVIVLGTHGRSGLDRYLLGSVTEKVVRKSDVPVLTVRRADEAES